MAEETVSPRDPSNDNLEPEPDNAQLVDLLASVPAALRARAECGDADFVVGPGFRLTFGHAETQSRTLAARLLAAGVGKGSRVGIYFPNGPSWLVTWLACARVGALTVPLSTFSPGPELARVIRHTDLSALLMGPSFGGSDLTVRLEEALPGLTSSDPELELPVAPYLRWAHVFDSDPPPWSRHLPDRVHADVMTAAESEVVPADALVMVNTSGSTADPKTVVHSHGGLIRHVALLSRLRRVEPTDRLYCPMPFFWVGGLTAVLTALTSGASALIQERFEPGEALELMEREQATLVQVWPNAARALADHATFGERDLTCVRGGTLPEALPTALRPPSPDRYPGVLGMTETGGPHSNPDDPYVPLPEAHRGSLGRAIPGVDRKIVDGETGRRASTGQIGELFVRGPFVMDQVYKIERWQTFTPDGWLATGDRCSLDTEGHVRFSGRKTAMIKTSGSNVSPAEVESVLLGAPGVAMAYVFGVTSQRKGEEVAAVVIPTDGAVLAADELVVHARRDLSSYKVPCRWVILDRSEVPLLPTGKVDHGALRSLVGGVSGTDR